MTVNPLVPAPDPKVEHPIQIGRKSVPFQGSDGKEMETEVFTMRLGDEKIELLPFKNWGQLDVHKWGVRGKLPATPAGLEITRDHVKVAGETISLADREGVQKLEKVMNEWLALERATLNLARKKVVPKPTATPLAAETQPLHFRVEMDHEGQVHVRCVQGKECLAEIGLNLPGWNSLVTQGLMHKPKAIKVGALHDWIELDGELYSFEKGRNDSARLEQILNAKYLSNAALGQGKDVVVFTNAASSTGFDIQFSVTLGGTPERRRRPLNEEALELLQDTNRCGVLRRGIVIKLTRPSLIFKQKTSDGGERYLTPSPENVVRVLGDNGQEKTIDLSQPVNYLHLSALELTAVFNHPSVNQHGELTPAATSQPIPRLAESSAKEASPVVPPPPPQSEPSIPTPHPMTQDRPLSPTQPVIVSPASGGEEQTTLEAEPKPNEWLAPVLAMPQMRFHWFARLVYGQLAERFDNSHEGKFGPALCWFVAIGESQDIEDFQFHGVFLTEKGSLGFLHNGHVARFYKAVAFLGAEANALEGVGVELIAVGVDSHQRIVFIVSDDYRTKFGVTEQALAQEIEALKIYGAAVLGCQEALQSLEPLQVVWVVPEQQDNPEDPAALEATPLAAVGAGS